MFEKKVPIAPWIRRGEDTEVPVPIEEIEAFQDHPLVYARRSEVLPHVSAYNFTKQAFFDGAWDSVNMRARGFFVSDERIVVGRSYDKFQAHKELAATPEECNRTILKKMAFPTVGYDKLNGFLGISGYDSVTDSLVLASKSRIDGDFAAYFRTIAHDILGEVGLEKLHRLNRDQIAACVFEVIDPVNDPHIVKDAKPRLVLLDVVRRHHVFERMPYDDLLQIGAWLGCEVKQIIFKAPNWIALERQIRNITTNFEWTPRRGMPPSEGVVIEGANGWMLKEKSAWYRFWKWMRTAKDLVLSGRMKNVDLDMARYADEPLAIAFLTWAKRQPNDVLAKDIVFLRDAFEADPDGLIVLSDEPPQPIVAPASDYAAFLRGVDAIAAQIKAGTVKTDSVRRIVAKADEDQNRRNAFEAHPESDLLREFILQNA